jgi:hypothetical protein
MLQQKLTTVDQQITRRLLSMTFWGNEISDGDKMVREYGSNPPQVIILQWSVYASVTQQQILYLD